MKTPPEFVASLRENSEHISCPICGSNTYARVFEGTALRENFIVCVICKNCTHIYLNPRPSIQSYKEFYSGDNYFQLCALSTKMSLEEKLRQFENEDYWRERFGHGQRLYEIYLTERLIKDDLVFDFGCGDGAWLWALHELTGCRVDGQEISELYGQVVSKRLGIDIFLGPVEELGERIIEKHKGKVKLAIVSGSLQHMLDPMMCLRIAHNILTDDGYLYVCNWSLFEHYMCSYQGTEPRRLPAEVFSWEHVHYFHETSYKFMLEKAGFEIQNLNLESLVRPRHMEVFARKKDLLGPVSATVGFDDIVARLRALESATLAERIQKLDNAPIELDGD